MSASRLPKICVYCGGTENLTKEHAPPKLIYPKPRPQKLITVWACEFCNSDGSKDAEYFLQCLCLHPRAKSTPIAEAIKPTFHRAMNRPDAIKRKVAFISTLTPTQSGFLIDVDVKRLHLVVERTVQCLYFHEFGKRIPDNYEATAMGEAFLQSLEPDQIRQFHEDFTIPLGRLKRKAVGNEAFSYCFIHGEDEFVSMWCLMFYGAMPFIVVTGQRIRPLPPRSVNKVALLASPATK